MYFLILSVHVFTLNIYLNAFRMKGLKIHEMFEIILHNVQYRSEHLTSVIDLSHWSKYKSKQMNLKIMQFNFQFQNDPNNSIILDISSHESHSSSP